MTPGGNKQRTTSSTCHGMRVAGTTPSTRIHPTYRRLRVAPNSRSVLNNVCIEPIRTSGRASAHRRRISSKRCIQNTLDAGSWSASRSFAYIASETPHKRAFSRRQRDIRVRLPPKRADAEPQALQRERGEAIAHERHTLERNLDRRKIALLLQVTERRRTSRRRTGLGRSEIRSGVGAGRQTLPSTSKIVFSSDK